MAVGAFARQGHEQLARLDRSGIDRSPTDRALGPGEQPAAG